MNTADAQNLKTEIIKIAHTLGFSQIKITNTNLEGQKNRLEAWLDKKYYGNMDYLLRNHDKRLAPDMLFPGTKSIICVSMEYKKLQEESFSSLQKNSINIELQQANAKIIASYAKGKDYHVFIRKKLQKLADAIKYIIGDFSYRAFTGSAPILEKALAEKAGIGWVGKNSLVINQSIGSCIFLGELFTNLDLPIDLPAEELCKNCLRCLKACPTKALEKPYQLNATKCIAYFTIEYKDIIPEDFRSLMGTHIFGCEICQTVCPWNKWNKNNDKICKQNDENKTKIELIKYFLFSEKEFFNFAAGSSIKRITYDMWLRNIAIALGNCKADAEIVKILQTRRETVSDLTRIHIDWALNRHKIKP